jgi:hypothetical protein
LDIVGQGLKAMCEAFWYQQRAAVVSRQEFGMPLQKG